MNRTIEKFFFSIIIPTYNSGETLPACLESILNQTFQNFEIIIVDGLSSDDTVSIVKRFKEKSPNVRWVSEKDKGIYDAMNKGIKMAKGEWTYFLGSDDTFYDRFVLENIERNIAENSIVDVWYGNVYSKRFNGVYDGEFTNAKILNKNICHQAIFFRKSVFKRIGGFNLKYKAHADYDHNIKWFLSGNIVNRYTNLLITNYADGGFSSLKGDKVFSNEKRYKYLLYGKKTLDRNTKVLLLKMELRKAINTKQMRYVFSILLNLPYFLR